VESGLVYNEMSDSTVKGLCEFSLTIINQFAERLLMIGWPCVCQYSAPIKLFRRF